MRHIVAGVWQWDAETRSAAAEGRATDQGGRGLLILVHTGMALRNGKTVKDQVSNGAEIGDGKNGRGGIGRALGEESSRTLEKRLLATRDGEIT